MREYYSVVDVIAPHHVFAIFSDLWLARQVVEALNDSDLGVTFGVVFNKAHKAVVS